MQIVFLIVTDLFRHQMCFMQDDRFYMFIICLLLSVGWILNFPTVPLNGHPRLCPCLFSDFYEKVSVCWCYLYGSNKAYIIYSTLSISQGGCSLRNSSHLPIGKLVVWFWPHHMLEMSLGKTLNPPRLPCVCLCILVSETYSVKAARLEKHYIKCSPVLVISDTCKWFK